MSGEDKTRKLVVSALLLSVGLIANYFRQDLLILGMPTLRFSLGEPFFSLIAILFGPFYGAISGGLSDVLSFLIKPSSMPFNPVFTGVSVVKGFLSGYFFRFISRWLYAREGKLLLIKLFIALGTSKLLITTLNSILFVFLYYNKNLAAFPAVWFPRLLETMISLPIIAYADFLGIKLFKLVYGSQLYIKEIY